MKSKNKPKFIVIEGGEGTGKSTLINYIREYFGDSFVFTREPGGTPFAETIRNIALKNPLAKTASAETLFSLMWASRHDNINKFILPALKSGKNVLVDRFDSATFAYQVYGFENLSLEKLFWQTRKIFLKDKEPDLYIILDLDPKIGLARVAERAKKDFNEKNHLDEKDLAFHNRVRKALLKFSKKVPSIVLDVSLPLEDVKKNLLKIFNKY